jgi:hypothetical protein
MTERDRARANAYKLRAEGLSISEVAERLAVPRATVGGWLRGVGEHARVGACELCGDHFVTSSPTRRFCTPAHAHKHRDVRGGGERVPAYAADLLRKPATFPERTCRLCGDRFTPTNGRQRFCTPDHRDEYQRLGAMQRAIAGWQARLEELEIWIGGARPETG